MGGGAVVLLVVQWLKLGPSARPLEAQACPPCRERYLTKHYCPTCMRVRQHSLTPDVCRLPPPGLSA